MRIEAVETRKEWSNNIKREEEEKKTHYENVKRLGWE